MSIIKKEPAPAGGKGALRRKVFIWESCERVLRDAPVPAAGRNWS
jgi:hypothetical protein